MEDKFFITEDIICFLRGSVKDHVLSYIKQYSHDGVIACEIVMSLLERPLQRRVQDVSYTPQSFITSLKGAVALSHEKHLMEEVETITKLCVIDDRKFTEFIEDYCPRSYIARTFYRDVFRERANLIDELKGLVEK